MNEYIIIAKVSGKVRYWSCVDGLHAGTSKMKGYSVYKSLPEAQTVVDLLESLFAEFIEFDIVPSNRMPFIKKQLRNR